MSERWTCIRVHQMLAAKTICSLDPESTMELLGLFEAEVDSPPPPCLVIRRSSPSGTSTFGSIALRGGDLRRDRLGLAPPPSALPRPRPRPPHSPRPPRLPLGAMIRTFGNLRNLRESLTSLAPLWLSGLTCLSWIQVEPEWLHNHEQRRCVYVYDIFMYIHNT